MNLPNGKSTKSQVLYIREWRKYSRFLQTLGVEVIGFDPSFLVRLSGGGRSFELPLQFVETLITKVTK